jgi:S-methylmethionine-dependent homocysteine/selenocysteine methylase
MVPHFCIFYKKVFFFFVIQAGCDIIETNTYQASIPGFMKYLNCTKEESYELIKKAVLLAKTAIDRAHKEGILQGKCNYF